MKLGMPIIVLLSLISLSGCADMTLAENSKKPIEVVTEVADRTQKQIFSAAKSWVAETSMARLEMIDSDQYSGRLVVKGIGQRPCESGMDCLLHGEYLIQFTLRIDTKDGKFKMTYLDLGMIPPARPPSTVRGAPYAIILQRDVDAATRGAHIMSDELLAYVTKQSTRNW
jgi:hypothetical protein